jgi:DNA-3-methyladenine glycosylase
MVKPYALASQPVLSRRSLPLDPTAMARSLIGRLLVRATSEGRMSGRIVEVEAYLPDDAAAHSYRGLTKRNRSMFLRRGHAYVYFIYGTWFALNVSGGVAGEGAAVLIRAVEPLDGLHLMRARRPRAKDHRLASGPGCLATAFGLDFRFDGVDLCAPGELWLAPGPTRVQAASIGVSTRIGISKDIHLPLRFYERGNPCLSGPRHLSGLARRARNA